MERLTRDDVKELGFLEFDHYTVGNSMYYDLGRNRFLSIGSIGTPNEILAILEKEHESNSASSVVILHNYDYDGYLSKDKINNLIQSIGKSPNI